MNARGQAELLVWLPRLLMLLVAVIAIVMLVRYYDSREVDASELARASYRYRLHYDPTIFVYKDPVTDRAYPGVIDLSKFTSEHLTAVFPASEKISSHLVLTGSCVPSERVEIWHDELTFEQFEPFAARGVIGPGSATMENVLEPVTIRTADAVCAGMLNLTIVRPNS